jgi:hypothetical protein
LRVNKGPRDLLSIPLSGNITDAADIREALVKVGKFVKVGGK